ncbi:MAG: type II secretion system protein M [SAR324 cluster bacterium]|nr:type II secretion system protein M [SAR324 cluster bacterium]
MVLSRREKLLLAALAILVVVAGLLFVSSRVNAYQSGLERRIFEARTLLTRVVTISEQLSLQETAPRKGGPRLSLIGHLEQLAGRAAVKNRLQLNRIPQEKTKGLEGLEVKLDELTLDEMIAFIYSVENSDPVLVLDQLDISPSFRDRDLLRVTMRVLSRE